MWSWKKSIGYILENWVEGSWKESIWYTMIKLGQMVLKGVIWIHNYKIKSNGLEKIPMGT